MRHEEETQFEKLKTSWSHSKFVSDVCKLVLGAGVNALQIFAIEYRTSLAFFGLQKIFSNQIEIDWFMFNCNRIKFLVLEKESQQPQRRDASQTPQQVMLKQGEKRCAEHGLRGEVIPREA